ncbi:MAG: T6SS immunity protein Tli4 family protein [Pseudomonadota bacterium]|nr:T6SS immunity protein Tli4 family protein [Pseudomonadota bacterium]
MSPLFTRKHARLLAKLVAAACILVACIALTRMAQAAYLNYQVKNMTAELKELKMKTMCVGRFLIDVPADAEVSYRGAMIAGWSIATYDDETDEQFAARIMEKEIALSGKKNQLGMPSLESIHKVDTNGVHGKIHVYDRETIPNMPAETGKNVQIEAMVRAQKHSFNLTIEFADDSDLKELGQLVTQFRSRAENEIPTEAGFCFDGGFIVDPLPFKPGERTTMFVGLKGHPDVSIMLNMTAGITTPKTLLQRAAAGAIGDENRSRYHTFRSGPRPFNGAPGEELLERVHEFNGDYGHSFMWELVHNKTDSVFTPLMSMEMTTGNAQPGATVDSSLSDAEALALWDKLLSSLRVRPL